MVEGKKYLPGKSVTMMKQEEYIELLHFCAEHKILCLEYHRRHGPPPKLGEKRFAQIKANPTKGYLCHTHW